MDRGGVDAEACAPAFYLNVQLTVDMTDPGRWRLGAGVADAETLAAPGGLPGSASTVAAVAIAGLLCATYGYSPEQVQAVREVLLSGDPLRSPSAAMRRVAELHVLWGQEDNVDLAHIKIDARLPPVEGTGLAQESAARVLRSGLGGA